MTFDDDFIVIHDVDGQELRVGCKFLEIEWPPPEELKIGQQVFVRRNYSQITDEQRQKLTQVMRGAEYVAH